MKHPQKGQASPTFRTRLVLLGLAFGISSGVLEAQGCAMCKTSVAAQAEAVIASLGLGVAILLFPPLVIVSAILYTAVRRGG